jgi:hypothetical protein
MTVMARIGEPYPGDGTQMGTQHERMHRDAVG